MSRFIHACVIGATLVAAGCGSGTPELAPVKDTKQADPDQMKKMMEESMKRNAGAPGAQQRGATPDAPVGESKTP